MSQSKNIIALLTLVLLIPSTLYAQLTLDGELRPRSEYRNGYQQLRTSDTEPALFTSQRTRLTLNYESDFYEINIAAQDVRVWGEVEQLRDNANVNIHEAWARVDLSNAVQLKLGRQELVYDDHRLLGSVNWTQQARSHDALVLKYRNADSNFQLDLGGAYNQEGESLFDNTYTLNNYKILSYLWMNKTFGSLNASAIILTDGFEPQPDVTNFRYTYGTHLVYTNQNMKISGTAYFQSGDDASRENISANMFSIKANHSLDPFQLKAGFDYLSGGSIDDTDPARHSFHTLYATNHKFYGHMDYFLNIPSHTRNGGVQDLYLGGNYKINDVTNLALTYHYLALANEISNPQNAGEAVDQYLGSEFDFSFTYKLGEEVTFRMGYSTLLGSSSLNSLQLRDGKNMQHWGWAMMVISPKFIQ